MDKQDLSAGDDQSEDGQLRSPYDISEIKEGEDDHSNDGDDTADSLEIKPPQAGRSERYAEKKSSRIEKKHSKEYRSKEHRVDRKAAARENRTERRHSHRNEGLERTERIYHNSRRGGLHHMTTEHDRYDLHSRERESYRLAYKEREREKKLEAERTLEDLRSRLLSKRNKHDAEKKVHDEQQNEIEYRSDHREAYRYEQHYERKKEYSSSSRHREHKSKKHTIDVIDSPENYGDLDATTKYRDKIATYVTVAEDPELIARRAKLLDAEREMARRKELAREELEARREMRRERDETQQPSPRITSNKRNKRYISSETNDEENIKRPKDGDYSVVHVSDNSMDNTASDTDTNSKNTESEREESENELLVSPLSVGELSKSERRRRSISDQSRRSGSLTSKSRSASRTHSRSKSPISKSQSRSRTPSRSPRLRNRSRSVSSEFEKDKNPDRPGSESETVVDSEAVIVEEVDVVDISEQLPNYYPGLQGCRSVEEFQCLNRIEEGTYGVVYRARDKRTEEIVALKRLKMEKEKEGFPITSLREINTLLKGQHPNIVTVREIVVGSNMDKIFIVMDYVEHDLKSLMETMKHRKQAFLPGEVKCLTQQLLRAVGHLHDNWILHRDLKTSNLLLSHKGILKVGDFGLAREYGSPLKPYTSVVVTLWYRAPELLLCCKEYSIPIDMWSVGCIFAEFLSMTALFPGKSEIDQLNRIFKDLGTPNEKIWNGYNELPAVQKMTFTEYPVSNIRKKFSHFTSELGLSLLQGLLTYDPKQRLSAEQGLKSNYFKELPLPIDPAMFPTWPAKSELGARKALASSPKPPSGGDQFKQLGDADDNRGFVLNTMDSRQLAMGPGFSLKF